MNEILIVIGLIGIFMFGCAYGTKSMIVKAWCLLAGFLCFLIIVIAAIVEAIRTFNLSAIPTVVLLFSPLLAGYVVGKLVSRRK